MEIAHSYKRIIAYFIDSLIYMLFYLPLTLKIFTLVFSGTRSEEQELIVGWGWILSGVMFSIVYEILLIKWIAALPGQLIMGIRIVDETEPSKDLEWLQSVIRVFAQRLSLLIGMSGFFLALINKERRTLADYLAETKVVQNEKRNSPAKAYWVIGGVLILIAFISGVLNAVDYYQALRFYKEGLDIFAFLPF